MAKRKIKGNMANLLTYIGSLYRNPADAIKEYISNALDEWQKVRSLNNNPCEVTFLLEKERIVINYNSPGMDKDEFENALDKVADSSKLGLTIQQIGQLGIGIFAFNQIGNKCIFFSKKAIGMPTIKAVLRKHSDEADLDIATKQESRKIPGMTIIISGLQHDPTKVRGPLGAERLKHVFSEKFDSYLRDGNLRINIMCNKKPYSVAPMEITFPKCCEAFEEVHISNDWSKYFKCKFWFDASAKSTICIRHSGIPIVDNIRNIQAYGLEDSVYASGYLKGYIDADFLTPLPARTGFAEDESWINFLKELEKIMPSIDSEIQDLRLSEEEKKLTEIQKKAIELANEILQEEQFKGLELLGGLKRERSPVTHVGVSHKTGVLNGTRSKKQGTSTGGMRIAFAEIPFENGPSEHSRFISGIVQVNKSNIDYKHEMLGSEETKLGYATLMIGKETIAYNDKTQKVNDFLEDLLSYLFQVKRKAKI